MLICDSRERWTQPGRKPDTHISAYLERHKIPYTVRKLDVGDYMLEGGLVSVDRKQGLEEVSRNLLNPADKKRFWNEVRLAHSMNLRLVVLVEDSKHKSPEEIRGWKSAYSPATGAAVLRQMERLRLSYGVEFVFCPRRSVARRIMEILESEVKNASTPIIG